MATWSIYLNSNADCWLTADLELGPGALQFTSTSETDFKNCCNVGIMYVNKFLFGISFIDIFSFYDVTKEKVT